MAAKLVRTKHPGIYKRGSRYVVAYRANGRQRRETVGTLRDALRIKRQREADRDRDEYQEQSRVRFREYAEEWVERYVGGSRGFDEGTRDDYRRDLERYAYPFFDERLGRTVSGISPRDVANWIAWLCDQREQGRRLADATVKRIASPVRACLSSAREEDLIRRNPADRIRLPKRESIEAAGAEETSEARPFSREQLDTVLRVVHPDYRPMFRLLATTGLRWSEAAALRRGDLDLDGSRPLVRVRRAIGKPTRRDREHAAREGRRVDPRFKTPKSRHGRRDVPIPPSLADELRRHLAGLRPDGPESLAFPSTAGTPLRQENVRRRVLRPAVEEAGAGWAGFHAFRHTFASLHVAAGTNLLQLSRLLGHHSPEFTLRVYAHLLPGDESPVLDVDAELARNRGDRTQESMRLESPGMPPPTQVGG